MNALQKALVMLLEAGYAPKEIAHQVGVGVHTVYRSDPMRFKTARKLRFARSRRRRAKKR